MKKYGLFLLSLVIWSNAISVFSQMHQEAHVPLLRQVEPSHVCMVNNTVFQKKQTPIKVAGKTYYSCCPMCSVSLRQQVASRFGKDPVSGRLVDKSSAIIGATSQGHVYYFESKRNFMKWVKHLRRVGVTPYLQGSNFNQTLSPLPSGNACSAKSGNGSL